MADKITNVSKTSSRESNSQNDQANNEIEIRKQKYIFPENELRLL